MPRSSSPSLLRLLTAGGVLLSLSSCQSASVTPVHAEEAAASTKDADPTAKDAATRTRPRSNEDWWPEKVDLSPLRKNMQANPYGADFDYPTEFAKIDLADVKADLAAVLTDSKDW
ncbi:MAG: catalase-peroxidase, partial [Myxococcota bacterium]|nr:catalase-peroxidase [Myxococcota bacterium]